MGSNMIKLGPYSDNFIKIMAVDTSGEYFWDIDRLRGCGNDLIFELEITRTMYVDIITASVPVSVWLDVWGATDPYSNISSEPLADIWNGAEYIPFPTYPASDEEDPDPTMLTFYLSPGKYKIQLQGCPKYNYADISAANQVICLSLRGTCMDYN